VLLSGFGSGAYSAKLLNAPHVTFEKSDIPGGLFDLGAGEGNDGSSIRGCPPLLADRSGCDAEH
jgi:hypothetical protein